METVRSGDGKGGWRIEDGPTSAQHCYGHTQHHRGCSTGLGRTTPGTSDNVRTILSSDGLAGVASTSRVFYGLTRRVEVGSQFLCEI